MWHGRKHGCVDCILDSITPLPACTEGALLKRSVDKRFNYAFTLNSIFHTKVIQLQLVIFM